MAFFREPLSNCSKTLQVNWETTNPFLICLGQKELADKVNEPHQVEAAYLGAKAQAPLKHVGDDLVVA